MFFMLPASSHRWFRVRGISLGEPRSHSHTTGTKARKVNTQWTVDSAFKG